MSYKTFLLLCAAMAVVPAAHAQKTKKDSVSTKSTEGDNRNVMLNAADSYKPREIQIGLPSEDCPQCTRRAYTNCRLTGATMPASKAHH